jgi:hypothetical protein
MQIAETKELHGGTRVLRRSKGKLAVFADSTFFYDKRQLVEVTIGSDISGVASEST